MTMFDNRTNLNPAVVKEVRDHFQEVAFQTVIPRTIRFGEAPSPGRTILEHDPSGAGAAAYRACRENRTDESSLTPSRKVACSPSRSPYRPVTDLLDLFHKTLALLQGHFVLRSGLHSRQFFQCALVLQDTRAAAYVCGLLAEKLKSGGRLLETIQIVQKHGGIVAAAGSIVDRSGGSLPDFGCLFVSLVQMNVETFEPDKLPNDLAGIPAIKPGGK